KVKAPKLASYEVVYDNIDLLHPGREDELIAELKLRTGIKAVRVNVKQVDLQKSNALIVLKYRGAGNGVA
ncbi:MAG: hypothetical protein OSA88_14015, partial [Acidimicrobiales bacterium]|nr:hypothetical protein [Acidimicrobiales bacterium]